MLVAGHHMRGLTSKQTAKMFIYNRCEDLKDEQMFNWFSKHSIAITTAAKLSKNQINPFSTTYSSD